MCRRHDSEQLFPAHVTVGRRLYSRYLQKAFSTTAVNSVYSCVSVTTYAIVLVADSLAVNEYNDPIET